VQLFPPPPLSAVLPPPPQAASITALEAATIAIFHMLTIASFLINGTIKV